MLPRMPRASFWLAISLLGPGLIAVILWTLPGAFQNLLGALSPNQECFAGDPALLNGCPDAMVTSGGACLNDDVLALTCGERTVGVRCPAQCDAGNTRCTRGGGSCAPTGVYSVVYASPRRPDPAPLPSPTPLPYPQTHISDQSDLLVCSGNPGSPNYSAGPCSTYLQYSGKSQAPGILNEDGSLYIFAATVQGQAAGIYRNVVYDRKTNTTVHLPPVPPSLAHQKTGVELDVKSITPDDRYLFGTADDTVLIFDRYSSAYSPVFPSSISGAGAVVASGNLTRFLYNDADGTSIFNKDTGGITHIRPQGSESYAPVALSNDGDVAALLRRDNTPGTHEPDRIVFFYPATEEFAAPPVAPAGYSPSFIDRDVTKILVPGTTPYLWDTRARTGQNPLDGTPYQNARAMPVHLSLNGRYAFYALQEAPYLLRQDLVTGEFAALDSNQLGELYQRPTAYSGNGLQYVFSLPDGSVMNAPVLPFATPLP